MFLEHPCSILSLVVHTFFMEEFTLTNMFAWICTVFAHLIIGCEILYPKIYKVAKFGGTKILIIKLILCSRSPEPL